MRNVGLGGGKKKRREKERKETQRKYSAFYKAPDAILSHHPFIFVHQIQIPVQCNRSTQTRRTPVCFS